MSLNPVNLGLRFALELIALYAMGYWGYTQHTGILRYVLAAGLPLLAAVLWGTFSVPGDRPNSPVPVPGAARLLLEALFFGAAVWAFYASGRPGWGLGFGVVVLLHYLVSYDRVLRLLIR